MQKYLILALLLLNTSSVHITDKRVKCFFEKFYELVDISADAKIKANAYLKTFDFSQQRTLNDISKIDFFDEIDFKTPEKLARILMNVNQMNDQLRRIVENCFPLSNELKRRCDEAFPKEKCEVFDGFVAARNCQNGFFGIDWVYCVPHCPSNYDEDPDDPFVCRKTEKSSLTHELAVNHGITSKDSESVDDFGTKLRKGSQLSIKPVSKKWNSLVNQESEDDKDNSSKDQKSKTESDSENNNKKTKSTGKDDQFVKKNPQKDKNQPPKQRALKNKQTRVLSQKGSSEVSKPVPKIFDNTDTFLKGVFESLLEALKKPKNRKELVINRFYPCPEGYLKIGADICVRTCPFGWSDFGESCAKPLVKRRDFELFFYSLDIDGAENVAIENEKKIE